MIGVQYLRPTSLAEVHACLQKHPQAQLLAGGQSLLAAMRLGLAHPSHLVDLQDVPELQDVRVTDDGVWIGAMATHARIAAHPEIQQHHPMLAKLAHGIADQQVRNVGTIGGSLVNNDPAACWPAGVLAYGATLFTSQREIPADQFFTDLFTTALQAGEVLLGVLWPACASAQYVKYEQPASRFAMVGVAVTRTTRHDNSPVRVAITGLGNGVTRWPEAEAALQAHWSVQALNGVHLSAELAHTDVHASASYRAHLSAVLCRRAVAAHTGEDTHLPRTTHGTRSPHARTTGTVAPGLSIHGSHELTQAVPLVWDALLDPVVLQQCIPGCESIQRLSDTLYTAVVKVGLGPVSARFETQIRVMPVRTPSQGDPAICHLHLSGQAGSLGQGEAEVVVQLTSPDAQGTHLQWQATPKVSGQLAQLGNRLMQASARSLSTQFFERLARVLSGQDASPAKFGFFSAVAEFFRHWHQLIFRK
jgi:CO/xanthine dehydrogenase FAD-binding subunit/carbon monoxide dehydrogenase subunit G